MESFNNHQLSTEHNWTPNQLWINSMLREVNPLAILGLDDDPHDTRFYGEDLDRPTPFDDSDNCVIVSPVHTPGINTEELVFQLTQYIDALKLSIHYITSRISEKIIYNIHWILSWQQAWKRRNSFMSLP